MSTRWRLFPLLLVALLCACAIGQPSEAPAATEAETARPTPAPTLAESPEPTEGAQGAYGRDRENEYVYIRYGSYHEIDCPYLYGDLEGMLLPDAIESGYQPYQCCAHLGEEAQVQFERNVGFERTMLVKRKIHIVSEAGKTASDLLLVTTGDVQFDINNNFINYSCRYFYKEFNIDPADIKVYVRNNGREYHNLQCERAGKVSERTVIFLSEAYEQNMTACKTCYAPSKQFYTMPVKADDDAHFYYVTPAFISRALKGDRQLDPSMNIDMDRIEAGYYD